MAVELMDMTDRCPRCKAPRSAFLREEGVDRHGTPFAAYWSERIDHPASDCERLVTLQREEWPTLW
jgi:hypothetical protein